MKLCPKCNKELEDNAMVCDACGVQIFETIFCPNCGEKTSTEFAFCQSCGAGIVEGAEVVGTPVEPGKEKGNILKSMPKKKALLFGGIGVALVAAVALVGSMFLGGGKNDYAMYIKDKEIVYTDFSKDGAFELTSRLVNESDIGNEDLDDVKYYLGYYMAASKDGNRIFFPDRIGDDDEGLTLYYRDVNKPKQEAVKIDSDVIRYAINDEGTKIVYLKGEDGNLYYHDLKEKEKIASEVQSFNVSEDFKKVGYLNDENNYYLWYPEKDAVKLAGDIDSIIRVAPDLSYIYYTKEGGLYKQVENSDDKVKIASDVSRVIAVYDSGEVYYTKQETVELKLMDYVNDDLAASDATLTMPEYPSFPSSEYPSWFEYENDEEYAAAVAAYEAAYEEARARYQQDLDAYNTAYAAYREKISRDSLRENLENRTLTKTEYTLCYFNGTEEVVLTDALVDEWGVTRATKSPVMLLDIYNQAEIQKVKISEIESSYEVSDLVEAALYSSKEKHIAIGSSLTLFEQEEAESYRMAKDGSMIIFFADVNDEDEGDLYKVTISKGQVGAPELVDNDVSLVSTLFTDKNEIGYYKNYNSEDYKGDFYLNGKEVDYDVRIGYVEVKDGVALYYTDWNSSKDYGTLKMFKGDKKTTIADDVHDFERTDSGDVLYLYDYSMNNYTGTLYRYKDSKAEKIDDDVVALIRIDDSMMRGVDYGF